MSQNARYAGGSAMVAAGRIASAVVRTPSWRSRSCQPRRSFSWLLSDFGGFFPGLAGAGGSASVTHWDHLVVRDSPTLIANFGSLARCRPVNDFLPLISTIAIVGTDDCPSA